WCIYRGFTYIALLLTSAGREAGFLILIRHFEFFPSIVTAAPSFSAWLVWCIGIVLALCILILTATSVSRIAFEDLRGNELFQIKDARQFSKTHGLTAVISLAVTGVLLIIFFGPYSLLGLFGRIPVLGELTVALLSIPSFFWGLAGTSVLIVFIIGLALAPAITACTGEDALEVIIQLFSSVFKQPFKLVVYEIIAEIAVTISTLILIAVSFITLHFMMVIIEIGMGYTFNEILTVALYRIAFLMESPALVYKIIELGDLHYIPYIVDTEMITPTIQAAGWILGISLLLVFTWIGSYFFSGFYSSQVIIYLVIRKHKNGDDLRKKTPSTQFVPEIPEKDLLSGKN
ncbi:MAG: hypothetical protein HOC71_07095, partial [Candidatus Latescibacteria bacterium]|nr:hypothetical protein [Candidatus Latescibacterota bacterium]